MREFSVPAVTATPAVGNLTDDVVHNGVVHPRSVACRRRGSDQWTEVTAEDFLAEVRAVAKGLLAAGVASGERVAVISRNRYEWTVLEYAIWFAGAVSVPVFATSPVEEVRRILADSGARLVVTETPEHRARVEKADDLREVSKVWTLEEGGVDSITSLGAGVSDDEVERRRTSATPESLATIGYTPGTTGRPKGCMLSHGNLMSQLMILRTELAELFDRTDAAVLLCQPLAHVFARVLALAAVSARVTLAHSADPGTLTEDLAATRPTFVLGAPQVLERAFDTTAQPAAPPAAVAGAGRRFAHAAASAIAFSRALDQGGAGLLLRTRHALFERLVYRGLRSALGGRCEFLVSAGAPLAERLGHFYRGAGVEVLEGYGLTETTGGTTANVPGLSKPGTAGRPFPGTSVRVDDGELAVRGRHVFAGYWNDPAATRDVLDEHGWLHTGDVGEIDDEGFVRVLGRKQDTLVTAGGKSVAPAVLEEQVRAHPLVGQCLVVGDGRPFIAALVTLDLDACSRWARQQRRSRRGTDFDLAQLAGDPGLLAEVEGAVQAANESVSRAESIRRFSVLAAEWTEDGGQLTATLGLRRDVVSREHHADVQALYLG